MSTHKKKLRTTDLDHKINTVYNEQMYIFLITFYSSCVCSSEKLRLRKVLDCLVIDISYNRRNDHIQRIPPLNLLVSGTV